MHHLGDYLWSGRHPIPEVQARRQLGNELPHAEEQPVAILA